jgi:hypothetical protein
MPMTTTRPESADVELISILQRELDSAWDEFFSLGDQPWSEQRIAAQHVIALRHQIEALGTVAR